jgi:pilus assembly protein CpaF
MMTNRVLKIPNPEITPSESNSNSSGMAAARPSVADSPDEKTDPAVVVPNRFPPPPAEVSPTSGTPNPASSEAPQFAPGMRMPSLGVIDSLLTDPTITEILVNDLRNIMVEKQGKMQHSGARIQSIEELNRIVRNIVEVTGRILSVDQPYIDVMLPDGSRVNIVAPPITVGGPSITIRRFPVKSMTVPDLMRLGSLDQRMAQFLQACVVGKLNIVISGGTGSGKSTLLGALSQWIPTSERLVIIEDTPELRIPHTNSVRLQTKPQMPSSPPVSARDLVANSLRMRPDRIIVGECRRAEAFDMLQAMNTGHEGSMTSLHANSPRDALSRLETLCMLANSDLPLLVIRKQIESAVDLIVQVKRLRDGTRKVTSITEVNGVEGDTLITQEVFRYRNTQEEDATAASGNPISFVGTGIVPRLVEQLKESGIVFPPNFFSV